jgi:hypothetical protein
LCEEKGFGKVFKLLIFLLNLDMIATFPKKSETPLQVGAGMNQELSPKHSGG